MSEPIQTLVFIRLALFLFADWKLLLQHLLQHLHLHLQQQQQQQSQLAS